MKKVVIHKPGGYRQLVIEECPDPEPADDEVLIDVHATGVNFADCVARMGLYASARRYEGYPLTPGFEAAGTVRQTGKRIDDLEPGTAVIAVSRFNACASCLAVKRQQVFRLPPQLTTVTAAALPTAALTAWFAIHELVHPHPGDNMLVHSAAGGVGSMLVQMGKLAGCHVTGVVGATHKVDSVRQLGVDKVIDKSRHNLWAEAEKINPDGFAVVMDANGASTLRASYAHLAAVGKLVVYGFHGMLRTRSGVPKRSRLLLDYLRTPRFSPFELTTLNRSVLGFNLSYLFDRNDILQRGMEEILEWIEAGRLRLPAVTRYPLEDVAAAHRDLESGQTTGKLVLTIADESH